MLGFQRWTSWSQEAGTRPLSKYLVLSFCSSMRNLDLSQLFSWFSGWKMNTNTRGYNQQYHCSCFVHMILSLILVSMFLINLHLEWKLPYLTCSYEAKIIGTQSVEVWQLYPGFSVLICKVTRWWLYLQAHIAGIFEASIFLKWKCYALHNFFVCLPMIWIDCFFFDLVFFFFENVKTPIKLWSEGKSDSQQLLLFLVCRTSASFWVSLMWENNEFCISALGTRSERKYLVSMSILLLEFMLVLLML